MFRMKKKVLEFFGNNKRALTGVGIAMGAAGLAGSIAAIFTTAHGVYKAEKMRGRHQNMLFSCHFSMDGRVISIFFIFRYTVLFI